MKFLPNFEEFTLQQLFRAKEEIDCIIRQRLIDRDKDRIQQLLAYARLTNTPEIRAMEITMSYTSHDNVYASFTVGELMDQYDDSENLFYNVQNVISQNGNDFERDYAARGETDFCLEIDNGELDKVPNTLRRKWNNQPWGVSWMIG